MRNVLCLAFLALLISACSSLPPYETEDWRVAIVDSDTAEATVRYEGFGSPSSDPAKRAAYCETLKELAEDKNPSSPLTPRMSNARRYFLVENGSLIMVEQGEIPNPLSWFEQSGLNPMTWFSSDVNMSVKNGYVIKWGFSSPEEIVAASGQVMNERDYSRILASLDNRNVTTDKTEWDTDGQTIIVWPGETRAFNWKTTSIGYLKNYPSLAYEFTGDESYKVEPALNLPEVINEARGEKEESALPEVNAEEAQNTKVEEVSGLDELEPEKTETVEENKGQSAFDL
jgi:hypothetical protein